MVSVTNISSSIMAPSAPAQHQECVKIHSSEYVIVVISLAAIFIMILALYCLFFKWVFEVF